MVSWCFIVPQSPFPRYLRNAWRTDPRTHGPTDWWTDKVSYRDAWTHLKIHRCNISTKPSQKSISIISASRILHNVYTYMPLVDRKRNVAFSFVSLVSIHAMIPSKRYWANVEARRRSLPHLALELTSQVLEGSRLLSPSWKCVIYKTAHLSYEPGTSFLTVSIIRTCIF